MTRVLVTGASGFVGRQCVPLLLEAGAEVHAVTSGRAAAPGDAPGDVPGATWHGVNLLDLGAATALLDAVRPTHVLHTAWFAKHGEFWTGLENLGWVSASLHLARAGAERGLKRFVGVGTCAEYDPAVQVCDELASPLAPVSLYGTCKQAAHMCLAAAAPELKLSTAWARLFFPYGQHDAPQRLVPFVIRSLLAGEPAKCSAGTQVRDLLHVRDVASALVALLMSDVEGPVNVASGEGIAVGQVIRRIGELLGRPDLIRLGALPMRADEAPRWVAKTERLNREVGWTPSISLDAGLAETIDWVRAEVGA